MQQESERKRLRLLSLHWPAISSKSYLKQKTNKKKKPTHLESQFCLLKKKKKSYWLGIQKNHEQIINT